MQYMYVTVDKATGKKAVSQPATYSHLPDTKSILKESVSLMGGTPDDYLVYTTNDMDVKERLLRGDEFKGDISKGSVVGLIFEEKEVEPKEDPLLHYYCLLFKTCKRSMLGFNIKERTATSYVGTVRKAVTLIDIEYARKMMKMPWASCLENVMYLGRMTKTEFNNGGIGYEKLK